MNRSIDNAALAPQDTALSALYQQFSGLEAPVWWFADEHIADMPLPAARPEWQCFSNRCDIAQKLSAANYPVKLGDFELGSVGSLPKTVCYRVSKEKALVHHLINQALQLLPLSGVLLLSGHKNDGLQTYAKKAAAIAGSKVELKKMPGAAYLARIVKEQEPTEFLPDSSYTELQEISDAPRLYSKPGVFGWQKIDRGSELLAAQLPAFFQQYSQAPERLADLGCGYGYITVVAAELLPGRQWLLTDNNATALLAAAKNCEVHGIEAELALLDCADGRNGPVDAVLCNPPFHKGFAVAGSLTDRFIGAAHRLLRPGGRALFVVNEFIPVERKASLLFKDVRLLSKSEGFKVVSLTK
jgi:16S rRNA (guanine1207-N2)-methyltransferase